MATQQETKPRDLHFEEEPPAPADLTTRAIQVAFAHRRRRQLLSFLPFVLLVLILVLSGEWDVGELLGLGDDGTTALVAVAVLSFFGYSLYNWRCPACNRYLGQRFSPKSCPHCGVTFQ